MDNEPLNSIDTCVYLGVTVNSRLRWNRHIDQISAAANRMLGFLRRTLYRCPQHLKEKTYKAVVHPKLEYCSSIWDPHQQKYIDKLEMTQRRAARFVKPVSVSAMVSDLGWEPLQTRRLHNRLTMMYKITNGLVEVPQECHPAPRLQNTTRGHTMQFQSFQPVVDAFKYAFLPRTIPAWNALPQLVAEADSLDTFKQHLSRHQQFSLSAFCTMHLVHICFTVHLFIASFYTTLRRTVFRRC